MYFKNIHLIAGLCLATLAACGQKDTKNTTKTEPVSKPEVVQVKQEPHPYGGWYCPDNLNGFPPVNVANWKDVPVINGRMASKEETRSGASLIYIDPEKHPDAHPLDLTMPQLAHYKNQHSGKKELIIVIQAIQVNHDSIVGFRYLNGGNGSAWLHEVDFLANEEIAAIPTSQFVTYDFTFQANQDEVWKVLTDSAYAEMLRPIFDTDKKLQPNWRKDSNLNFFYPNHGPLVDRYANKLYGCFYIQNDHANYVEKFLLLEDGQAKTTTLKLVCGPFENDFDSQQEILYKWATEVKALVEKS